MSVADILSTIGIFVSLVGGFLTAYFSFALARKRKIVEYEITTIPLNNIQSTLGETCNASYQEEFG